MAVYRNIHISFWEDTKVLDDMDIEERYFMLYLLTNPHSNQVGCFEISKKQMINETGFNSKKINQLLEKFENQLNLISYFEETKELFIKNWFKYNWTRSPKVRICIEKEFLNIKSEKLREELYKNLVKIYGIDTLSIRYEKSIQSLGIKKEKEKEKEKEEEEEVAKATSHAPIFDFPSILEYGKKKKIDEKYCQKFYEYYADKNKKWSSKKEWQKKLDKWYEEDQEKKDETALVKLDEGVYKI